MITNAQLLTRVKTNIRADMATPATPDLNNASITLWANEFAPEVISVIKDINRLRLLFTIGATLAGRTVVTDYITFNLPTNFEKAVNLRITGTDVTRRDCREVTPDEFSFYDSQNFIVTPSEKYDPICSFADKCYIKPNTITAAILDYICSHPEIGTYGTKFDSFCDILLIDKIMIHYYAFINNTELMGKYEQHYINMLNIEEKRINPVKG